MREGEALRLSLCNPGVPRPPRAPGVSVQQLPPRGGQRRSPVPFSPRGRAGRSSGHPTRQKAADPRGWGSGEGLPAAGRAFRRGRAVRWGCGCLASLHQHRGSLKTHQARSAPSQAFGCCGCWWRQPAWLGGAAGWVGSIVQGPLFVCRSFGARLGPGVSCAGDGLGATGQRLSQSVVDAEQWMPASLQCFPPAPPPPVVSLPFLSFPLPA